MLRSIILAALIASAAPALAGEAAAPPEAPVASMAAPASPAAEAAGVPAPSATTVNEAPAEPAAQATFDVPTAAPGDAPTSPTILDRNGDVLVTGSVGAPSRPVPPPARLCVAPHGACALPPVTGPGQVCECFTFGIGSEQGIAE